MCDRLELREQQSVATARCGERRVIDQWYSVQGHHVIQPARPQLVVENRGVSFRLRIDQINPTLSEGLAEPISPIACPDEVAKIKDEGRSPPAARARGNPKLAAGIAATILIAVLGGYLIHYFARRKTEGATPALVAASSKLRIVPLTNLPGWAGNPALSPNGQQVAFFWNGEKPAKSDLYVQLVGGEKPLQLTHSGSGFLCWADWSSDGREIVFVR